VAAAYNEAANSLAARVLADPDAAKAQDELRDADRLIGAAEAAFATHQYHAACALAVRAYNRVVDAAAEVGVPTTAVTPQMSAQAAPSAASPAVHQGDEFIDSLAPDSPRSKP
jgi:hypothetical protein